MICIGLQGGVVDSELLNSTSSLARSEESSCGTADSVMKEIVDLKSSWSDSPPESLVGGVGGPPADFSIAIS